MELERYLRNQNAISPQEQALLSQKRIVIIGCGGLGGYLLEQLGRLGVGFIRVVDSDLFEESNLNRQLLSSNLNLGKPKVLAAKHRMLAINPLVEVDTIQERMTADNVVDLLAGCDLVLDALDNIPDRFILQQAAKSAQIPFVHGAVAGWQGQVCLVLPGQDLLNLIYGDSQEYSGDEQETGTLAFTVGLTASLMAAISLQTLLNKEIPERKLLLLDAQKLEFTKLSLPISSSTQWVGRD
jgi:molybdopterin/thiamine biosynthesis adenylyltransferase